MDIFYSLVVLMIICNSNIVSAEFDCSSEPADVVFVLDSSYSIWPPDFIREVKFMEKVISTFNIGPDDWQSRVGALTFGHGVWPKFYLNSYFEFPEIQRVISNIKYEEGERTNTGDALTFARDVMFSELAGARKNSTKIAIVVTDGRSQSTYFTKEVASYLQEDGIHMFAVSIGFRLDEHELAAIASDPDENHYFSLDDYSSIQPVRERIDEKICGKDDNFQEFVGGREEVRVFSPEEIAALMEGCDGKRADIFFMLDASYSISQTNFGKETEFVQGVINILDIGPNTTRIGVMSFSDDPKIHVKLENILEKDQYKTVLNSTRFMGGGTNTAEALQVMRNEGFYGNERNQREREVARIAIVLTDGLSLTPDVTAREAENCRKAGIQIFVVGIGDGIDKRELTDIASKPTDKFLLHVDDFGSLLNIKNKLAARSCTVEPLQGIYGGFADQAICHPKKATDLLFVYDALTLGSWRSQTISQFAAKSVQEFSLMAGDLRIGREVENCPSGNIAIGSVLQTSDLERVEYQSLTNMLRRVNRQRFSGENGGRVNASKMAVIFVDAKQRMNHDTFREAQRLKDKVDFFYIVTIGKSAQTVLLKALADKGHSISVNGYDDLMAYADKMMADMCDFFFMQ